jgi:hypothetical protein
MPFKFALASTFSGAFVGSTTGWVGAAGFVDSTIGSAGAAGFVGSTIGFDGDWVGAAAGGCAHAESVNPKLAATVKIMCFE